MVGGDAMQSALHFGLNLGLLRALPAREYGVFALVMLMGGVGLNYIRALTAMPVSVGIGRSRSSREADCCEITFGSVACVLATIIAGIVACVLISWHQSDVLAGSLFIGLWSLRSHLRMAIYARGTQTPVAIGDIFFTVSGVLLSAVLWVLGRTLDLSSGAIQEGAFATLAIANGLGIAAMLIARRRRVRVTLRRSVRQRYTKLWRRLGWSGVGITTSNLQSQGLALIVGAMAGPAAYAPIAAIFVLFVPMRLVATAVANTLQPELAADVAAHKYVKTWQHARDWTLLLGGGGLLYGAGIMFALPWLNSRVLDGAPIHVIGALAWAGYTASILYVMPRIILEAEGAMRILAIISAVAAVVCMASVAAIVSVTVPAWSLLGALASELIVLIGSWLALRRVLAHASRGDSPARFRDAASTRAAHHSPRKV